MAVFSRLGAAEVMALSFSKGHVQSLFSKNGVRTVRSCNHAFSLTSKVRLYEQSEPQSEPVVGQARRSQR
ncbi:hypothetical protein A1359_06005 [Methylomonas lenta]|uniref:Uncharacterized protein n=1 Tax=Methylomonas lenta TaxID=980561 RepID=A0A177NJA6_9GAMM|nr:hypothetical protein A1359_06005 [Methylomonas lenta]